MDDARRRELETDVMMLLEQMTSAVEEAQSFIQDDSRISGGDFGEITDRMMKIRALSLQIDARLRPPHRDSGR